MPWIRLLLSQLLMVTGILQAQESPDFRRIPDEYESAGGHSLAFGQGGSAALTGISAVLMNPAMLAIETDYQISAGYHWPSYGRDFYQAGVVDSRTSVIAAGINYTGFNKKLSDSLEKKEVDFDSPLDNRLSVGLAKVVGNISVGLTGNFLKGHIKSGSLLKKTSGTTLGLGLAGLITKQIRFGISAQNINNNDVILFAPKTYRAGLAVLMGGGDVTMQIDLKRRERVGGFESQNSGDKLALVPQLSADNLEDPEDLAIFSFSARVYDLLRVIGAYGSSFSSEQERRSISGGLALVQQNFSLSYNLSRPFQEDKQVHSNINLNMNMAM